MSKNVTESCYYEVKTVRGRIFDFFHLPIDLDADYPSRWSDI